MKKFCALLLMLFLFLVPASVSADMGGPEIAFEYDVYVDMDGWNLSVEEFVEEDGWLPAETRTLAPGTRLHIDGGYSDGTVDGNIGDNYNTHFIVDENELKNHTVESGEVVGSSVGKACDGVKVTVNTKKTGLNLRMGPSKDFPSRTEIPKGTEITYTAVYGSGSDQWGYTSYKGKEGWVSLSYTKAAGSAAEEMEESGEPEEPEESVEKTPVDEPPAQKAGMSRVMIIILCCCGALALALTALVVILLLVRKKEDKKIAAEIQGNDKKDGTRYCPMCGASTDGSGEFCASCGYHLGENEK